MAGRQGPGEISEVKVTGRDGATALVRVSVPPPECPPADQGVEKFEDQTRKVVMAAMMDPESVAALKRHLQADNSDAARKWWSMCLAAVAPILEGGKGAAGAGGVRIVFDQRVPAPVGGEDGPIGNRKPAAIDVTDDAHDAADGL